MAILSIERPRGRGRQPADVELIRDLELELLAERTEGLTFAEEVRAQACRIDLAVRAERPDLALHIGSSIVVLADRRIRQIGSVCL
jgi:hypothetical protein